VGNGRGRRGRKKDRNEYTAIPTPAIAPPPTQTKKNCAQKGEKRAIAACIRSKKSISQISPPAPKQIAIPMTSSLIRFTLLHHLAIAIYRLYPAERPNSWQAILLIMTISNSVDLRQHQLYLLVHQNLRGSLSLNVFS
jgi:hypothetical protein